MTSSWNNHRVSWASCYIAKSILLVSCWCHLSADPMSSGARRYPSRHWTWSGGRGILWTHCKSTLRIQWKEPPTQRSQSGKAIEGSFGKVAATSWQAAWLKWRPQLPVPRHETSCSFVVNVPLGTGAGPGCIERNTEILLDIRHLECLFWCMIYQSISHVATRFLTDQMSHFPKHQTTKWTSTRRIWIHHFSPKS